jgi:hypothetical protein
MQLSAPHILVFESLKKEDSFPDSLKVIARDKTQISIIR